MSVVTAFLSQPIVERIGWALVHFLWQAAVVAALLGVALLLLQNRSPNARYLAACAALAVMLAAPALTFAWHSRPVPAAAPVAPARDLPEFSPAHRPPTTERVAALPPAAPTALSITPAPAPRTVVPPMPWKNRVMRPRKETSKALLSRCPEDSIWR